MSLSILDLYRLQLEFQEYYDTMQMEQRELLQKLLVIKLESIEACVNIEKEVKNQDTINDQFNF
jgi:predicted transcriptional regulator